LGERFKGVVLRGVKLIKSFDHRAVTKRRCVQGEKKNADPVSENFAIKGHGKW